MAAFRKTVFLFGVPRPWEAIRHRAALGPIRLHDLRHTFAATGAGSNLGLPVIGKLLGHRRAETTSRYAHIAADPLKTAADAVTACSLLCPHVLLTRRVP
jgi:integrase